MSQGGWVKSDFGQVSLANSLKTQKRATSFPKSKSKSKVDDSKLWINKHKAESIEELVVQKKKIADVKQWLQQALVLSSVKTPMLLLTGPSGCGKYQTLSLLCKELSIDIHQWEEPIRYTSNAEYEFIQGTHREGPLDLNPLAHLAEFLSRANRYSSLVLKNSESTTYRKKIVLVKDLPSMVYTNLNEWHDMIRNYSVKGKTPIVFIVTEGNTNYGTSMRLFPTNLQEKLTMSSISFNALANTFVSKALQRVLSREKKSLPLDQKFEDVVESSNGDLRCAINSLQWLCVHSTGGVMSTRGTKKRKLVSDGNSSAVAHTRDGSLDFMHALGKVLYAKRSSSTFPDGELPPHLVDEMRVPLQENVDTLVDKICESPAKVLLYIHQNYPSFFGRIEDAANAAHNLSTSELFSDTYAQKEILDQYSLLTSVRGVMHSNTEVVGNSWRPLKKPEYWNVQQKVSEMMTEGRSLWPLINDGDFFPERIPFMKRMSSLIPFTAGQKMFLQKVGTFQRTRFSDWANQSQADIEEMLDDRNVFRHVVEKSGTDANQSVVISTSQTPSIEENDEEIIIENYDSD